MLRTGGLYSLLTTTLFHCKDNKGAIPLLYYFAWDASAPNHASCLVDDLGNDARAYSTSAFADRETQSVIHRNRTDQLNNHLDVVAWHHHLNALR